MSYFSAGHGKITGSFISGFKCMCIGHTLFSRCFLQAEYLDLLHGRGLRMVQEKGHVQCGTRGGLGGCLGEGLGFQISQFSLLCHMPSARAKGPAFLFPISLCLVPFTGELLGNKYIDTERERERFSLNEEGLSNCTLLTLVVPKCTSCIASGSGGIPASDVSFACRSSPT